MKQKFNPNSDRAIAGKKFQESVLKELQKWFPDAEDFREKERQFGIDTGSPYTESELSILEKTFGDITFTANGQRYYVECCFAMGDKYTNMCELKREGFVGFNKWYCWGKRINPKEIAFIPSRTWFSYLSKVDLHNKNGWRYRRMEIRKIGKNIRAAKTSYESFFKAL